MVKMEVMFKKFSTILMFTLAIGFTFMTTVLQYIKGNSSYIYNLNTTKENIMMPVIVVCPENPVKPYVGYNVQQFYKKELDFLKSNASIIEEALTNIQTNPNDYWYTETDIFTFTSMVDGTYYQVSFGEKTSRLEPIFSGVPGEIVVSLKEKITWRGKCFEINTNLSAPQAPEDGLFLRLNPIYDYVIYLHHADRPFPYFSPGMYKALKKTQRLEISVSSELVTYLDTKGQFQYKQENCKMETDTISWAKRLQDNFMKYANITCKPTIAMDIFNFSTLDRCSIREEAEIFKTITQMTDFQKYCKKKEKCLPVCSQEKLLFQTEALSGGNPMTELKIRGREDKYVEITEDLDSHPSDILIAFGGYLGLFSGKSLLDFIIFIIHRVF